jgi:hypothetical protein
MLSTCREHSTCGPHILTKESTAEIIAVDSFLTFYFAVLSILFLIMIKHGWMEEFPKTDDRDPFIQY